MDAVWHGSLDGSRDEAGSWVWDLSMRGGNIGGECGVPNCNQWEFVVYLCESA